MERIHDLITYNTPTLSRPFQWNVLQPSLQSSVVATKVPPRPNADPNEDEKSKKRSVKITRCCSFGCRRCLFNLCNRNRRMFGVLMGTLQKFKESEDVAKKSEKVYSLLPGRVISITVDKY